MKKIALILAICVFIHAEETPQIDEINQNAINQTQDVRQEQNAVSQNAIQESSQNNVNETLVNQKQDKSHQQPEYIFKSMSNTDGNVLMDCKCFATPSAKMDCTCSQKESRFNYYFGLGLAQQVGFAGGGDRNRS